MGQFSVEKPELPGSVLSGNQQRMPVRLPNGSEILVPCPAGRSQPSEERPSIPAMGAHTSRIRMEFAR